MSDRPLRFELLRQQRGGEARRGRVHTRHAVVETPVFMPVGTQGAVKSLDPRDLDALGARIILSNAYHLLLRPGAAAVAARGGLHRFMRYDGAILTDSGGYQVFSLKDLRKLSDAGVEFRSHVDGRLVQLTPESLVAGQEQLGPDIAMVLDECPPAKADREHVARAVARTTAWAKRAVLARARADVAWFGIVQGALFPELRREHAAEMRELDFDGFAVGGVSVGEDSAEITEIVRLTAPLLPRDKPRYLMGVGTPGDLVRGVAAGIDMFDCVLPTRNARNGQLFTSTGRLVIKNAANRDSDLPVDAACRCYTCRTFSRAYLRHLYVAGEVGYHRLATIHNLSFYLQLMAQIRAALDADTFDAAALLAALGPAAL
ncbi:MAG: tRNA guanosine(34) transglycosylase Tgt [Deltaproteobacteria bacterium]|nr:tRNA guanosine(34) transglycosylase Tgt [Deltaproteobacteria bacterium]